MRKRLGLLESILEEYKKELNKFENIVRLTVTSAVDVEQWKRDDLKHRIQEKLQKEADINWKTDSSIIGGLIFVSVIILLIFSFFNHILHSKYNIYTHSCK